MFCSVGVMLTNGHKIAPYFAKVECFCFEEQKLLAGEEVDMPLLFFIDKDILDDPTCANVDDMVLSYTFFRSVNLPGFLMPFLIPAFCFTGQNETHEVTWSQTRLTMLYLLHRGSPSMSTVQKPKTAEMEQLHPNSSATHDVL